MRLARRVATVVAFIAIVLGMWLAVAVIVVRGQLLDEAFYADALNRSSAYERVYSEVLADPELAELQGHLLGDVDLGPVDPATARTVATNSLRGALPPPTLQHGVEAFLSAVLAYVRGDTDQLQGDIDVDRILDHLDENTTAEARAALAALDGQVVGSLTDYERAVTTLVEQLESGTLPASVPVAAASLADERIAQVLLAALPASVDPDVRQAVEAEVAVGNERDALVSLLAPLLVERASGAQDDLQQALEDGRHLDVVGEISEHARISRERVVGELDPVREAARWFGPATLAVALLLVAGGAGGLVALHRRDLRRACLLVGAGLLTAGLTTLGWWLAIRHGIDPPLGPATSTGPGSWGLPTGMRSVLRDLESALASSLDSTVLRAALAPIVAGGALMAGAALTVHRTEPVTRRWLAMATGVAAFAGLVVWTIPTPDSQARACNGHVELCDRPYDEIVQAATHNSMSSPDVVQIWPEHDGTIGEQLEAGIRVLLIDTHYWPPLASAEQLEAGDEGLPPAVADAIVAAGGDRLRGRDGTFLCHNHCALGGAPFVDQLRLVRTFLDDNPDEVVTLVIQDAITPADTADAFASAGLQRYLYTPLDDGGWPTLGELIDRSERLVVFAEEEGPPPPWYLPAFDEMQETPYLFTDPDELSCGANRGPADASLLLMNHWITRAAPDRTDAVVINSHEAIVQRARECEEVRGQLPDFIAVNFYGIGETIEAVDSLNGLDGSG